MTDSNLLELAKLGDPQAIAALMNQSLQPRGMSATVTRQADCLEVILEAERVPNRQALTAFVQQGINNLSIQSITSIRIVGQQVGASYPAWMQEVQMGAQRTTLDDLSSLMDSNLTAAAPLNIQPETEPEITAIPLDNLPQNTGSESGVETVDLDSADLSFLSAAELDDLADDLASEDLPSQELDAWSESEIAPDFLQELLANSDESEPGLFAESPDGSLGTLAGSSSSEDLASDTDMDPDIDLFFSDFAGSARPPETTDLPPDLFSLFEPADRPDVNSANTAEELDADLLDFLNQPDAAFASDSDAQPQELAIDALIDPAELALDAELTDADLAANPETASIEQLPDLFNDFNDNDFNDNDAAINEFSEAAVSDAIPASPSNSILASQIEDLFDPEIDQAGIMFTEEILPERPSETAEDLRQAQVTESFVEPAPESSDPWTVRVLPELSEARTVLDLPDDDPAPDSPENAGEPDFSLDQLLDDADDSSNMTDAEAENDLDTLFADNEEPPVSIAESDPNFYGYIADEEIAEENLEELPPDFLQDFSAEFPGGFPDRFSEVEAPLPAASAPEVNNELPPNSVDAAPDAESFVGDQSAESAYTDEITQDDLTLGEEFLAELAPPSSSSDLAAELAALDLITDSDPVFLDSTLPDAPTADPPTDPSPAADLDPDPDSADADLADLLSQTPQGIVIESDATPAEPVSSPLPEDFFSEPIAPAGAALVPSEPLEQDQPEVSQDALEAGLGDFREGFVEPLPEEFFVDQPLPSETDWQADLRDPLDFTTDDTETNYILEDSTPAVVYTPPPLPESEKAQATSDRSPAWLFPLVLFLVGGWIAGLLSFALLWSRVAPPPSPPPAGESPAPSPPSPTILPDAPASPTSQQPTPSPVANLAQGTPLKSAIEQASDAVALTQAAQSADDWGLVASKWAQAINLLKTVPAASPDYATAQKKLVEYGANVTTARRRANLPIVAAAPLGVANIKAQAASPEASSNAAPTGVVCSLVPSAPNSQPVELSRVQFDLTVDQAQAVPIVGCITNHSKQRIAAVNVAYKNNESAAEATTGNLNFGQLDPQQTVPFKSVFAVTPQVKDLTIASISWTATGTSEAKQFPAAINVTRGNEDG